LSLEYGPGLDITLKPDVLDDMVIETVMVDNQPVSLNDQGTLQLRLTDTHEVEIRHHGGVAMVPLLPRPSPGDTAPGPRILSSILKERVYYVDLEGPSGREAEFQIKVLDSRLSVKKGCRLVEVHPDGIHVISVQFPQVRKPYSARRIELSVENGRP
jgi:hypothetical protein